MFNIVILNWNSLDDVVERLNEIECYSNIDNSQFIRVFCINNNCSYKLKDKIKVSRFSYFLDFIDTGKNLGYAGGNNKIIQHLVVNKYDGGVLILNPDVRIDSLFFDKVVENMKNYSAFMFCATNENHEKLYNRILMRGFEQIWDTKTCASDITKTDYLAGSCFYLSREVVLRTGLFDERFFLYWEEVDLSFRVRLLGVELYSDCSHSVIRCDNPRGSIINSQYYLARNSFYMLYKHGYKLTRFGLFKYLAKLLIHSLYKSVSWFDYRPLLNSFRGLIDGIKIKLG